MLRAMLGARAHRAGHGGAGRGLAGQLKSARTLGLRTVLITRHGSTWQQRYRGTLACGLLRCTS